MSILVFCQTRQRDRCLAAMELRELSFDSGKFLKFYKKKINESIKSISRLIISDLMVTQESSGRPLAGFQMSRSIMGDGVSAAHNRL